MFSSFKDGQQEERDGFSSPYHIWKYHGVKKQENNSEPQAGVRMTKTSERIEFGMQMKNKDILFLVRTSAATL